MSGWSGCTATTEDGRGAEPAPPYQEEGSSRSFFDDR